MGLGLVYIILPLIVSNVLHMIVVKKNWLSNLTIPISRRHFGANKTWRGFVFVGLLNALVLYLMNSIWPYFSVSQAVLYGFLLGLTYMLFELPNSFLKRRLGIQSGHKSGRFATLFMLLDKMDSSLGISIVGSIILSLGFWDGLLLFVLSVLTHVSFSLLLTFLRIKKRF